MYCQTPGNNILHCVLACHDGGHHGFAKVVIWFIDGAQSRCGIQGVCHQQAASPDLLPHSGLSLSALHSTFTFLSLLLYLLTTNPAVADSGMRLSASTLNPRCCTYTGIL